MKSREKASGFREGTHTHTGREQGEGLVGLYIYMLYTFMLSTHYYTYKESLCKINDSDQGSRIKDQGSICKINDQGSRIKDQGSRALHVSLSARSRIKDQGSRIKVQGLYT
jgi:hypothetical protein